MAAPDSGLSVLVVDGVLGALHKLGFPLPALPLCKRLVPFYLLDCREVLCWTFSLSILAHL